MRRGGKEKKVCTCGFSSVIVRVALEKSGSRLPLHYVPVTLSPIKFPSVAVTEWRLSQFLYDKPGMNLK